MGYSIKMEIKEVIAHGMLQCSALHCYIFGKALLLYSKENQHIKVFNKYEHTKHKVENLLKSHIFLHYLKYIARPNHIHTV